MTEPKKELTMAEIGRIGGLKTKERHGSEHFKRIGVLGGQSVLKKYGLEHLEEMGRKGGQVLSDKLAGKRLSAKD